MHERSQKETVSDLGKKEGIVHRSGEGPNGEKRPGVGKSTEAIGQFGQLSGGRGPKKISPFYLFISLSLLSLRGGGTKRLP